MASMSDLWTQREFALMRAPVEEKHILDDQLLFDEKSHDVEGRNYIWTQTPEEIEIAFPNNLLTMLEARSQLTVDIKSKHLKVALKGQTFFDDDLWEPVRPHESTWVVSDGMLVVQLSKVPLQPPERNNWPRCGRSEPHKYDAERKAKCVNREARLSANTEEAMQEVVVRSESSQLLAVKDDMPEMKDSSALEATEVEEDSSEEEVAKISVGGSHKSGATTGTWAELRRLRQQESLLEMEQWKKGTPAEAWGRKENRPKNLGPVPLAEARRRGQIVDMEPD